MAAGWEAAWDVSVQLRTPAFPAGLLITAGVHCITQTSRVSGLTGSTPERISFVFAGLFAQACCSRLSALAVGEKLHHGRLQLWMVRLKT